MIFERGYFDGNMINESKISDSLREIRNFSASSEYTLLPTVFLSHKHDDIKDLRGVIGVLQQLGTKVYIDSMDNKMPEETNGDTAARIKKVIEFCDKFILMATDKAIESYWCNWELGIGDVHKFSRHIAILPIKEKDSYDIQYKGNEYLQLYSSIDYEDGTKRYKTSREIIPRGYYVSEPINKQGTRYITPLRDWLKQ